VLDGGVRRRGEDGVEARFNRLKGEGPGGVVGLDDDGGHGGRRGGGGGVVVLWRSWRGVILG